MPHDDDSIIQVGPGTGCPACKEQRPHTEEEWHNHPFHRHGMTKEQGWTHPDLAAAQACPDCIEARKQAYSDATTAGFFFTECPKHRGAQGLQRKPGRRSRAMTLVCGLCTTATFDFDGPYDLSAAMNAAIKAGWTIVEDPKAATGRFICPTCQEFAKALQQTEVIQ